MYEYHTKNARKIENLVSDATVKPIKKFTVMQILFIIVY